MASCITWFNDFFPSATVRIFYEYLGLTVRNLSLKRTSLTCDSESTVVCFLISCCCKLKLLFYIDTWHSGEQISELFWASVSLLEEWGIWSMLNYVFPLWDGWRDINATYLLYHFLVMLRNWTQGFAHAGQTFSHWATSIAPNIIIIISYFGCTGLELRTLCL
jgi:hypothetical protein